MRRFLVQAFSGEAWVLLSMHATLLRAITEIDRQELHASAHTPLRVWDDDSNVQVAQNPAAEAKRNRDADKERERLVAKVNAAESRVRVADTKPFSIVMSLDKPGPCERDGRPYRRHENTREARDEARRLSRVCSGGRFAVLSLTFVTGWAEADRLIDTGIPF